MLNPQKSSVRPTFRLGRLASTQRRRQIRKVKTYTYKSSNRADLERRREESENRVRFSCRIKSLAGIHLPSRKTPTGNAVRGLRYHQKMNSTSEILPKVPKKQGVGGAIIIKNFNGGALCQQLKYILTI